MASSTTWIVLDHDTYLPTSTELLDAKEGEKELLSGLHSQEIYTTYVDIPEGNKRYIKNILLDFFILYILSHWICIMQIS